MVKQNPKNFLKTNIFKSYYRHRISTKRDGINSNTPESLLGILLLILGHETTKKQQLQSKPNLANNFTTPQCSRQYIYQILAAKTVNQDLLLI